MIRYEELSKSYKSEKKGKLRPHKKIPKIIKDEPTLDMSLVFIWDSFIKLGSERLRDFGEIPENRIYKYFLRYNKISHEYDKFYNLISKMDKVYLKESQKKTKKPNKSPKSAKR